MILLKLGINIIMCFFISCIFKNFKDLEKQDSVCEVFFLISDAKIKILHKN